VSYRLSAVLLVIVCVVIATDGFCEEDSCSFELRYYSPDSSANGETDFKGETSVFDTDERIDFLRAYADYAKKFFRDPGLDKMIVSDREVADVLSRFKEQPQPEMRKRTRLEKWKWVALRKGQRKESIDAVSLWNDMKGVSVQEGNLLVERSKADIMRSFTPQEWRFSIRWKTKIADTKNETVFGLGEKNAMVMSVIFENSGKIKCIVGDNENVVSSYEPDTWYEMRIEIDLHDNIYNVYRDDILLLQKTGALNAKSVSAFSFSGGKGDRIDSLWGVGYIPTEDIRWPYDIKTFIDETFDIIPSIDGWSEKGYDDSSWNSGILPVVHGSERHAGEDLFLRRIQRIGEFEKAFLNVETLDPGGEIWINGKVAAVLQNRHPAKIEIGKYLEKNADNVIAVRVNHFNIVEEFGLRMMGHSALDLNVGWFAGRMSLDLVPEIHIDDLFVFTKDIIKSACLETRIKLNNRGPMSFRGKINIKLYPWYPAESSTPAAMAVFPVVTGVGDTEIVKEITVSNPKLWTFASPNLYRVVATLVDENGTAVDDYTVTAGIRTVGQDEGTFRINGVPEMLNGAQIFGYRPPIEKLVTWNRSCPIEWLVKELVMVKKMNGNLLRIHVHAWSDAARSVNDPRIAELADQLGVMLIWATPSWIRTAKGWGYVDFEGYPKYMRQVYNHPSIVMWEASNHPNSFKKRDYRESNIFCEKVYDTIYPVDPSRLISTTSYIRHLHYGNDFGTVDYKGNPIEPTLAWTAPMVTRGNQDSVTGYGKEWSVLRTWPPEYYKDHLSSKSRAYFNFEHEESIGQPNWNLVKGKPWYRLQSYEWEYDEGSIGRRLSADEWEESQAWQAFSAYESMKKQRLLDYDGFSWCCLHGGPNTATYKKPIVDFHGHAKLAYYANRMIFQRTCAGSYNVDVVYGPKDTVVPVIMNLGPERTVDLTVEVKNMTGKVIDSAAYKSVHLPGGRTVISLPEFKPSFPSEGYYAIEYRVN
jgi:hypothetical protein